MLEELIKNRKSVREYSDKNIPNEDLKKILNAGHLAPSWMNSQSWKFILVKNQETKNLLSELSGFQPHVKTANAVICAIADKNAWKKEEFGQVLKKRGMNDEGIDKILSIPMLYPPLLGDNIALLRSVEQVTYAVSYMMLQAYELGIDSCIIGAISNEATVVKEDIVQKVNNLLNLSEGEVLITMITLGYEKEPTQTTKQRKDFNKVVYFEKIGNAIDF